MAAIPAGFRTMAYLAPLLLGLGVAAALALTSGRPPLRRAAWAAGTAGAGLLVLAAAALAGGVPGTLGPLAALLGTFLAFAAGLYLLGEELALPPEACQLVSSLAVVFLTSTVFLLGPVVRHAEEAGLSGEAIARRIEWALEVNPFAVTGYSIFGTALLHEPALYGTGAADFQHAWPRWGRTALGYGAAALVLAGAAFGARAIRRRAFGAP
ncbi:MAG TPA: hypothetical protein VNO22_17110 [Planctomycetota bacterium]|jgi:hypothetical protein|nr:hypothetical protein [Planctomycetota bacterium]